MGFGPEAIRSEAGLAAMASSMFEGLGLTERGRVLDVNEQLPKMLGYTRGEMIGMEVRDIIAPEDRELVMEHLLAGRETVLEHRVVHKNGEVLIVESRGKSVLYQDRKVRITMLRDISERKRMEESLRLLEEQLRQAQKMEAIGQLAGGIAHDFRNQLTVIAGFAELLRDRGFVLPAGQPMLQELLKAAEQATHLTGQLLAFSRKQLLRPQWVELGAFAEGMCVILRRLIGEDIRLTVERVMEGAWVRVDETQLQHALLNIANNARDAMPEGGELRFRIFGVTAEAEVLRRHAEAQRRPYAAIAIADTGQGMDASTIVRIFEPFFTTKQPDKGTGLGLAMVYGFVNQSGGFIDVESEVGKGSTFTLYFPLEWAGGATGEEGGGKPAGEMGNASVLLVEDEPAVRKLMATILERAGYEAMKASDAGHARALLADASKRIDVLVSDVVMPGSSGVALAVEAKKLRPKLGVLLVSGYSERKALEAGLQEVDGEFLQKPFEAEDLLRAVRGTLKGGERK